MQEDASNLLFPTTREQRKLRKRRSSTQDRQTNDNNSSILELLAVVGKWQKLLDDMYKTILGHLYYDSEVAIPKMTIAVSTAVQVVTVVIEVTQALKAA